MFAIKIKGGSYIFPKRFPFIIGKDGDVPANIPFSVRFEMEKGKLTASSDGIFIINNSSSSLSVLKPGDVLHFSGIELKVERRFIVYLKLFSFYILAGFVLAGVFSTLFKREFLSNEKVEKLQEDCFLVAEEMEHKAKNDTKLLPSTIRFLERCVSSVGERNAYKRDELIKSIGALKSIQDEEFRRLKFEAERAIRNGEVSSALKSLQQIKEIIDDPSDDRWRYASYRMRELAE